MLDVLPACECGAPLHEGPHEAALLVDECEVVANMHDDGVKRSGGWTERRAMLGCVCDNWWPKLCDCHPGEPECPCPCHDEHGGPVA
jgi:hypothetical protein